ncbi:SAM hydrolase/SAM-dependent halogenase family protein [Polluticoccus soli]|uniref:SAM hydrolase/SAM-dependent halogenase family protein n=1 Tax=Polluticoccus soli TaxID=3034150 RepID=UPI0023E339DE|nr:SAM-dependent chlorinase/fluorinase [Flavipsychrobacter sp. JY13-12]
MAIVSLLSDFGLQDASVASIKAILARIPEIRIIDISHLLEPFYLQQAAYLLGSSYSYFPERTCHLVFFDTFYETTPTLVLLEKDNHFFLAPDNGILPLTFGRELGTVWKCFELDTTKNFKDWVTTAGEMVQALETKTPIELGLPEYELNNAPQPILPKIDGNTVECHVIHIDRFENVVLNLTREQFTKIGRNRPFRIQFMRDDEISQIDDRYNAVREGEKLCRFNAAGFLEIAINRGNAASLLGLKLSREQHVMYNTIKIVFE